MQQPFSQTLISIVAIAMLAAPATAGLTSPRVGWQTDLSTFEHSVSGTVTIVDDDTIRIDDFIYDGGGPRVYFYLGTEQTEAAFRSGLEIGPRLDVTSFDGSQSPLIIDLPAGETLEGYHAISVWCVRGQVDFGSGTFVPIPEPTALCLAVLSIFSLVSWRAIRGGLGRSTTHG